MRDHDVNRGFTGMGVRRGAQHLSDLVSLSGLVSPIRLGLRVTVQPGGRRTTVRPCPSKEIVATAKAMKNQGDDAGCQRAASEPWRR
ncbi:hypothetical protein [Propioniciclava flava]